MSSLSGRANFTLRVDTSAVHDDSPTEIPRSPLGQLTGRPRAPSKVSSISLRVPPSPIKEKLPTSPSHLAAVFASQPANRARDESQKLLAHLLGQLRNRPRPPSIFEVASHLDPRRHVRGIAIMRSVAVLTGTKRSQSISNSSPTRPESDSEDEIEAEFSTDVTYDLMNQLKEILSISLAQQWQIFYESPSMRRPSGRQNLNSRSSSSPFRRRRRSLQSPGRNSRSPSPEDEHQAPELLSQCISILNSVISEDCRYQISSPRLLRPPNALQAVSLDVTQLLIHMHTDSPKVLSQIGFAILPAFSTFRNEMHGRLLRFFEEGVLRGMLTQARQLQGFGDMSSAEKKGEFPDVSVEPTTPPIVSIQVEEAHDDSFSVSHLPAGWRPWLSSISTADYRISSSNAPGQAISLYHLKSVTPPLLAAITEGIDFASASLSTLHRFYRLFQMIIDQKPDAYLDILDIVAYHTPRARRTALSLLISFWPKALGHYTVSKPLPLLSYDEVIPEVDGTTHHIWDHSYAHQFVPWRFMEPSIPAIFDGLSYGDCRSCMKPITDFGLLCPYCTCSVHFDCYDYPAGNFASEYAMESDPNTQKIMMHRFCHVFPTKRASELEVVRIKSHNFRQVNLFTLSLCCICCQPLWGITMQALKCDTCDHFAHTACIRNISDADLSFCGSSSLNSTHMTISWSTLKQSFAAYYHDFIVPAGELKKHGFEDLSICLDTLWVQSQILDNGVALGSIVIDDNLKESPAQGVDPKSLLGTYEDALSSAQSSISDILDEYRRGNRLQPSQHSLLYDWPTLVFIASTIKTPHENLRPSPSNSFDLLAAQPLPVTTHDGPTHPHEVLSLAHLRDALGIAFQLHSDVAARIILCHLHHLGFYQRLDMRSELFDERPDKGTTLCSFPLPLGLDLSADVETLMAAIEACLSDADLSVNEAGLLLLVRRFWPSEMATEYALRRLTRGLLSWIFAEGETIETVLRDYASNQSDPPGVRSAAGIQPWPTSRSRSAHSNSTGNGGEYVDHRRTLLSKYVARWMLALHDQDPIFYSEVLHETVLELTEGGVDVTNGGGHNATAGLEQQGRVDVADKCLQCIIRLCQAAIVFTAFDDLFMKWLEFTCTIWHLHKPVPALQRLFSREGDISARFSVVAEPTTTITDPGALTGIDPWNTFARLATNEESLLRGLQWLCMFARSGVDIPVTVFRRFTSFANRFKLSVADSTHLARAVLYSVWLKSRGRQDLLSIIVTLHQRSSSEILTALTNKTTVRDVNLFIRQSLAAFLLLAGCDRRKLTDAGLITNDENNELPSRRKLSNRASLVSDPIHIDVEFITVLGSYVDEDNEDTSRLLAKFFNLFVNDCSLLESHEVDNFILRNCAVLSSCVWKFYEIQHHELAVVRPNLMLRVLVVYSQPFEIILVNSLQFSVPWELRLQALKRLFRIILDIANPAFNLEDRQWRSSAVCIFYHYFTSMWQDPQEEVRVAIDTWSQTLLPVHFEAMSRCWNESLSKAPISERVKLVAFLIQLHPHFPRWPVLTWETILETLLEDDYMQKNGEDEDGPASAHLSMYGVSYRESDDTTMTGDSDMALLRVSITLLSLKMIAAGVPIDIFSLLKLKLQILRIVGFTDVATVPSASGHMFNVSFRDLAAVPDDAWPCLEELRLVLDAPHSFSLPPASMAGARPTDEAHSALLIGSVFVDLLLALLLDIKDLFSLPFLTIKSLFESVLIIIYKHDMENVTLKHLQGSLRMVIRRIINISLQNVSFELRQLGLTISQAYIKRWPTFTGSYVLEATEVAARLVIDLRFNKEDVLVSQALSFLDTCISIFGESGLLIALCKRGQSDAFFAVLRLVTESDRRALSSHSTREVLLRDAFSRALETEVDAIKIAMQNLQKYVDLVFSQVYNAELMQFIGTSLTTIIRRAAEWSPEKFDPSPLISIAANLLQKNKGQSGELLVYLDNFLRAALIRFNVSQQSLAQILQVTANLRNMTRQQAPAVNGQDPSSSVIAAAFDILSEGLRRKTRVPPLTLSSLSEAISSTFFSGSSGYQSEWRGAFNNLANDGTAYLQSYGGQDGQVDVEFTASLSIAKMIMHSTEYNQETLHRPILEYSSENSGRHFLNTRGWNILVLAALNHTSAIPGSVLMSHFSAFVYTYCDSLTSLVPGALETANAAATINHGYAAIKLWLLLERKLSTTSRAGGEDAFIQVLANNGSSSRMIWNELWPPFENIIPTYVVEGQISPLASLISSSAADLFLFLRHSRSVIGLETASQAATLARLQISGRTETPNSKLARALRSLTEPSPAVPWEVLVEQATNDVLAAEKLRASEIKRREIGKNNGDRRRDSRVVS